MENISTRAMFAEPSLAIVGSQETELENTRQFTLDTTFVLFFLAMDLAQMSLSMSFSTLLQVFTLLVFLVVPYFLPFTSENRSFSNWLIGRIVVAGAGVMFGLMLGQAIGTVKVSLDGQVVAQAPLVAVSAVEEAGFFKRLWDAFWMWWESD